MSNRSVGHTLAQRCSFMFILAVLYSKNSFKLSKLLENEL